MPRHLRLIIAAVALTACKDASQPVGLTASAAPVRTLVQSDGSIPGHYVVVAVWSANTLAIAADYGIKPRHVYTELLNGFSAAFPSSVADALLADPRVRSVTVQRQMSKSETVTQTGATWGLDRIDQRALPMDSLYSYDFTGAGVTTYIIDTGIRYSHSEFEGRPPARRRRWMVMPQKTR